MKKTTIYEFTPEMRRAFNQGKTIKIKQQDEYGNESEVHIVPISGSKESREAKDGTYTTTYILA